MKQIAQGAEAKIFESIQDTSKNNQENITIIKDRFEKKYRIKTIDEKLRKQRTRREAKVIEKIHLMGFGPKLLLFDDKLTRISMQKIDGIKLRDILDKLPALAIVVGKHLANMHDAGIIHGDLTTSNMIFDDKEKKLYFIDFGLSFFSEKAEDKAVDIHLFKQAIESAHHKIEKKAYTYFLKGYKTSKFSSEILARLEIVEKRGRYKQKT